jgi:SOS-response transcriptional repressor LexA
VLAVELPGGPPIDAGVLLEDPATDRSWIRLRRDWPQFAGEESEVLELLEADLESKAAEMGAAKLTAALGDTLSNTVRITDRQDTIVEDFDRALARLYRRHVHSAVQEFVTHLPRYSLAAAAGPFLENPEIDAEGWEEAPPRLRLTPQMFCATVTGRSMEPVIPDGSLCVFRRDVAGSRQGKLVLVEDTGAGPNDRYTVKRYRSEKKQRADGTWQHDHITLEPLNPDFQPFDLNPEEDRYQIRAEYITVLD